MSDAATLRALRGLLFALLVAGQCGALTELLIAGHWEDAWQYAPLVLLGAGLVLSTARLWWRGRSSVLTLRGLLVLFIISGVTGSILHYRAKAEFALERHPELRGMALFQEALEGTTPPLLAPGAMIALGLLGLIWTYRHPALGRGAEATQPDDSPGATT